MKISLRHNLAGMTLVEMMTSVGCSTLIVAAIIIAGVALQRSFGAVEGYARTEADQLRVLDYISMDCRRCVSASVSANGVLTLTLLPYYNVNGVSTTPNTPTNANGVNYYGNGGAVTIYYSQSGSSFTRRVTYTNSAGTAVDYTTAIATNVSAFTVTDNDLKNTVTCSIMFFPTFLRSPGNGNWTNGTTIPSDSVGADGDWYVINSKGTDPTTVGNVYYRSGGHYSLLQNVKATQVYCNTFLRNAVARN